MAYPNTTLDRIGMKHGAGGRSMRLLIEQVLMDRTSGIAAAMDDGAAIPIGDRWLILTTDSHVIHPLVFPGGDIGRLAVSGTVNDLAMMGAVEPLGLACAVIVEEGFPLDELRALRASMERACAEAGATILTGDTKVMGRGEIDGLVPAALLLAWWADREAAVPRRRPVLAGLAIVAAVAGSIAAPVVLRQLDVGAVALRWESAVVVGGVVLVGTVAATALLAGRMAVTVPVVVASTAAALLAGGWIVDGWENRTWDYRRAATDLRTITLPLGVAALADDHELLQVDFYLGRSLPALRSPDAVSGHLTHAGAVVVDGPRWRSAIDWLRLDPRSLRAEALGADVLVVSRPP